MTSDEMLDQLSSDGENAGSDFNDGEDVNGWFGWTVVTDADGVPNLTVIYQPITEDGGAGEAQTARWRLEPVPNGGA